MKKDFAKVLKAKKEAPEKHREFIGEWLKKGHLAEVTLLYEAEKINRSNDAAFFYGLGYAYALTDTKQNSDAEVKAITNYETALQLDPSMFWAHYSLGANLQKARKGRSGTLQISDLSHIKSKILSRALLYRRNSSQTRQSCRSDPNPSNLHKP